MHDGGSSFSLEVAFLAATSGITERDGRESFPFSKVYWTVAILCLLCPILLLDSRRFSFSLVFSARGFRFHVFTFLHSHSGEEEKEERHRPKLDVFHSDDSHTTKFFSQLRSRWCSRAAVIFSSSLSLSPFIHFVENFPLISSLLCT